MSKKIKQKIFICLLISSFLASCLFLLINNANALQNDSDTEVVLHCSLETNSGEVYSSLMPTGTYSFFDEPTLNTGSFIIDNTRIDISDLQALLENTTTTSYHEFSGVSGNQSVNTSKINEYTLSAPKDSVITLNITYEVNSSLFGYVSGYSLTMGVSVGAMHFDGTYWWIMGYYMSGSVVYYRVYRHTTDFTYTGVSYSLGTWTDAPMDIHFDGTYWWVSRHTSKTIQKYTSSWSYTGTSYSYASETTHPEGIYWDGTYWWLLGASSHEVYKYTSSWSYTGTSYSLGNDWYPQAIWYEGGYWWMAGKENHKVYKYTSEWSYTGSSYSVSWNPEALCFYDNYWLVLDGDSEAVYKYNPDAYLSEDIYTYNFSYGCLGYNYTETYKLNHESTTAFNSTTGNFIYTFDSSFFSQYDYINDVTINGQNLTLIFDVLYSYYQVKLSIIVTYSSSEWKVPTEVSLTINSNEAVDSTYNSGYVAFEDYPSPLIITATEAVYFKLNITIDFTFTFDLDVISKTYLKKSFELETNHEINIERLDFSDDLNIKKIYLNNVDKGSSNPCNLIPDVSMDTGNVFYLEIILYEEIYLPLQYLKNNLGSGTSTIYLYGSANSIYYYNTDGNLVYSINLPAGHNPFFADLIFTNIVYTPDYIPDYYNDLSGYSYGSPEYGDEDVNWGSQYYQISENGTKIGESGGSGYEPVFEEYFSALNGYMSHTYGDLDSQNMTYTVSDYLYMENLFPSNLTFEDWNDFVHDYNIEYVNSNWSNGELYSYLNTYSEDFIFSNDSFQLINGTHVSNASLEYIDSDFHTFRSTIGAPSGTYVATYTFTDDADGNDPAGWNVVETGGTINVVSNKTIHSKVVFLDDTSGANSIELNNEFSESSGTIEFWLYSEYIAETYYINVQDGSSNDAIYFRFSSGNIEYNDGSYHTIQAYSADTWYHFRVEFDCSTDWHLWINDISTDGGSGYSYYGSPSTMDELEILTSGADTPEIYIDAVGYSWDGSYNVGDNYDPLGSGSPTINMTSTLTIDFSSVYTNDTVDNIILYYSYKTNDSVEINFSIYNYDLSVWDEINISTNEDDFYNCYFILNSSHYNISNTILLYLFGNSSLTYELYIDRLIVLINWTKTSGDIYSTISKNIDPNILNRYDSYTDFQDFYNVTINFMYRYSNYTKYDEFAQCDYDGNSYTLTKDETWHVAELNFEFDSESADDFNLLFNITNGLLEIKNMNYTIFFNALDIFNYNRLYQNFTYIPCLSLDYLQQTRGNWILNFTYNFTVSDDFNYYNFSNTKDWSGLSFRVYLECEDGWLSPIIYRYNSSQSNIDFELNITNYLIGLGKSEFSDFKLEFLIAGNPSNFSLDDLILFDYDSDFYLVDLLCISDTLVISRQNFTTSWRANDRYIGYVEIDELYNSNTNLIHNITLVNNTIQSQTWNNMSAGFYELNFTFFDSYGNWEKWTLNFTLINRIAISVGYENPKFIDETNTVNIHILTDYSITKIWYDNSTNYILYYNNSSFPLYSNEFNFSISYPTECSYNISIKVLGEYNDIFYVNVTNLCFIERTTLLDFHNLYSSYYQDEEFNVTFVLRDTYNNPLQNETLNYTITDPNDIVITNSSAITDSSGEVNYAFNFSTSSLIGFYHLNVSYTGTTKYNTVSKLQSFQVRPVQKSSNSTEINLHVNGHSVVNDQIRINLTNDFSITNNNYSIFDVEIQFNLNYTEDIDYDEYLSYTYEFEASTLINSLTFTSANLTNYPSNFTDYYYDGASSTSYNIIGNNLTINELVADTFYNSNSFTIGLYYLDDTDIQRDQIITNPRTDSDSVEFKEYLTANRTFSYWYMLNSYAINSISLYHKRTATTVSYSSFTIETSKYYFEKSCQENDLFEATIDYDPGWTITKDITINNGTYCSIEIDYKADINIENVTIALNLTSDNVYAENWTYSASQSLSTFVLEIPNINFTTSYQTITVEGVSSVPYALFSSFQNEEGFTIDEDYKDLDEWYYGYLSYPYYSQSFITRNINSTWQLDGVHYRSNGYDITSVGYFECPGWGTGISSSYLRFKTNPIDDIDREYYYDGDYRLVIYEIDCNLPSDGVDIEFYIEEEEHYTLVSIELNGHVIEDDEFKQVKLATIDGKTYYELLDCDLHEGKNEIEVIYHIENALNYSWLFIPVGGGLLLAGLIFWRLRLTRKEKGKEKKSFLDKVLALIVLPHRKNPDKSALKKIKSGIPSWDRFKEFGRKKRIEKKKKRIEKK